MFVSRLLTFPRLPSSALSLMIVINTITGAFQLYDINNDGLITYDEMLQIVQSIVSQ